MKTNITPGVYRHYKGNTYRVLHTALHSETLEEMVVYQDVNNPEKIWARPASMWNETVLVDGVERRRFEPVEETECADDAVTASMTEFTIKRLPELTTEELHEILKARAQVFTKEQEILYPDADGHDDQCWHVFSLNQDGTIASYLRMFYPEGEPGAVKMGRVLTMERGKGLGTRLMAIATEYAVEKLGARRIVVTSQKQAEGFYLKLGYETTSDTFIEAGIPHVNMKKEVSE